MFRKKVLLCKAFLKFRQTKFIFRQPFCRHSKVIKTISLREKKSLVISGVNIQQLLFRKGMCITDQGLGQSAWLDISQVLFQVFMDRDEAVEIITSQKRTRLISIHLDRTSLVNKGLCGGQDNFFLLRSTLEIQAHILPASAVNHNTELVLFCPLADSAT